MLSSLSTILVTGGAGFIGSNFIHFLFRQPDFKGSVVNVDKLTYAGNLENLAEIDKQYGGKRYFFEKGDICDSLKISGVFTKYGIDTVVNFAAESHVDRSIDSPMVFIDTNIRGTAALLEEALGYWKTLERKAQGRFRFLHISTDEVFGALGPTGLFSETTAYDPSSPYSASKAASDHLVNAWHRTFGLPILLTNCSNNYGPFQFPEKLIPLMIINCLHEKPLPVYGRGANVRDWLYVEDHCRALWRVLVKGKPGQSYNIGGGNELQNVDVVGSICAWMDELNPRTNGRSHRDLITFVADRPGHDFRYAIDCAKIRGELDWKPWHDFHSGLRKTVQWYLDNRTWWQEIQRRKYNQERLGVRS